ncbi:MAG: N-substituted formamide deformylase precursor [Firmicutes bacterium ADurb.Bin182]|nr:MAG: N-substituted formamide deformylase precursor [Firmicutes bacterium ADurb.Bin182]
MRTIFINGKVYTGELPLKEAFAVEDDRFVFAGENREALSQKHEASAVVDLNGKFVCAGFIDSHMHLVNFGASLKTAQLAAHTGSLAELKAALKTHLADTGLPKGRWLLGRGWNQDYFRDQKRFPNRYDLDEVSKDHPVMAARACGHVLAVNSKALEVIGVLPDEMPGGSIDRDDNGEPLGIFKENAQRLVYEKIPAPNRREIKGMILSAAAVLNSYGVTSCHSDDFGSAESPYEIIEAYKELEREGNLTVRVYQQSHFESLEGLKEFIRKGYNTGTGSGFFKIGPLKMLSDGSLGARTAYLSEPYADDPSTAGVAVHTEDELFGMISFANSHGMQVAVHAIGDRAMELVIGSIEKALCEHPRADHRHGVIHCQITTPALMEKFRRLSLHAYIQSIFLDYDISIVEKRIGAKRAESSYNFKTLMESGVWTSNGSDCPVELPDVLAGIQCAVTRSALSGSKPFLADQAYSVRQALDSYTKNGAHASFEENFKGRISPGFVADFVILDRDPFTEPHDSLKNIKVLATYLGGKRVYEAVEFPYVCSGIQES